MYRVLESKKVLENLFVIFKIDPEKDFGELDFSIQTISKEDYDQFTGQGNQNYKESRWNRRGKGVFFDKLDLQS